MENDWVASIDAWVGSMTAAGLAVATILRRRQTMATFAYFMAARWDITAPNRVTTRMIETWLAGYPTPRTKRAYYSDARLYYGWREAHGLGPSPMTAMPRPRNPKSLPRPIDLEALRPAVEGAPFRVGTWMLLGALAGLRVGEIARLHTEDVDGGVVVVREGKGSRDRAVPCHPALAERLDGIDWGWVAPNPHGGHLTPGWVSMLITRELHGHGIKATAHCLRHTFGTETARSSGGDVLVVARLMGHASTATTMGYVQVAGARQREVVTALPWTA